MGLPPRLLKWASLGWSYIRICTVHYEFSSRNVTRNFVNPLVQATESLNRWIFLPKYSVKISVFSPSFVNISSYMISHKLPLSTMIHEMSRFVVTYKITKGKFWGVFSPQSHRHDSIKWVSYISSLVLVSYYG